MALCMDNMQSLSLLDIMSKSYKKGMNEMDSAVIGIKFHILTGIIAVASKMTTADFANK